MKHNYTLSDNSEVIWSSDTIELISGKLELEVRDAGCQNSSVRRSTLLILDAPTVLPNFSESFTDFELVLISIGPSEVRTNPNSNSLRSECLSWSDLINKLDLSTTTISRILVDEQSTEKYFIKLIKEIIAEGSTSSQEEMLKVQEYYNQNASTIFNYVEDLNDLSNLENLSDCIEGRERQSYKLVSFLEKKFDLIINRGSFQFKDDVFDNTAQILETSGLVYRDVLISSEIEKFDCGLLIAFSENGDQIVIFEYQNNGYMIHDLSLNIPPSRLQTNSQLKNLNPQMIRISEKLPDKLDSPVDILRFTYGQAKSDLVWTLPIFSSSVFLGFLLSIGKNVGAQRWIFIFGFIGLLLSLAIKFVPHLFRITIITMLLATCLALLTPTFNTIITNQALPDRDLSLLLQICGILLFSAIARVGLIWSSNKSILLAQQGGAVRLQFAAMKKLLSLRFEFFDQFSFGDLQVRFISIDELRQQVKFLFDSGLVKALMSSVYILFMIRISVKLTLLSIVFSLIITTPSIILGLQARQSKREQEIIDGEAQSKNLQLVMSTNKLRLSGSEINGSLWWASSFKKITKLESLILSKEYIAEILQSVAPSLGKLLIFILLTKLLEEASVNQTSLDVINAGQVVGFFTAFGIFIAGIVSLSSLITELFDLPVLYERALPILSSESEDNYESVDPGIQSGHIELKNINFRYSGTNVLVAKDINLEIKPGQFIAFVGPSGCGKSTLVKLLLGFLTPESGSILYDYHPLLTLNKSKLRRQIGTVLQKSAIFPGTIFECIAGGNLITQEQAWKAAQLVGLESFISALPMGMNTVMGEGGGSLSGGQQQRLIIARSLVNNPSILIFDEATSALDNASQKHVTESIAGLNITRIVIAHRLSTIKEADLICFMKDGSIIERGTYEELISNTESNFSNLMRRQVA